MCQKYSVLTERVNERSVQSGFPMLQMLHDALLAIDSKRKYFKLYRHSADTSFHNNDLPQRYLTNPEQRLSAKNAQLS